MMKNKRYILIAAMLTVFACKTEKKVDKEIKDVKDKSDADSAKADKESKKA